MLPRLVVFDLAGTTVFEEGAVASAMAKAFTDNGIPMRAPETLPVAGMPKPTAIRSLIAKKTGSAEYDPALAQKILDQFNAEVLAYYGSNRIRPIDGAMATFDWLKRMGVLLAVDTGFDRKVCDVILERLGWDKGLFVSTIASDEVNRGRPFPDMVFELMKRCVIENSGHVAKVGDTPSDLLEGKAALCGWNVGVCEGTHTRFQLDIYPHTHLINNVGELPSVFEEE